MKKPLITIAGVQREMNEEEFEQYQLDQKNEIENQKKLKAEKESRDNAIKKLGEIAGLTEEELNAIL